MSACTLLCGRNLKLKDQKGLLMANKGCPDWAHIAGGLIVVIAAISAICFVSVRIVLHGKGCHFSCLNSLSKASLVSLLISSSFILFSGVLFSYLRVKEKHRYACIVVGVALLAIAAWLMISCLCGIAGVGVFGSVSEKFLLKSILFSSLLSIFAVYELYMMYYKTTEIQQGSINLSDIHGKLHLSIRVFLATRRVALDDVISKIQQIELEMEKVTKEKLELESENATKIVKKVLKSLFNLKKIITEGSSYQTEIEVEVLIANVSLLEELMVLFDLNEQQLDKSIVDLYNSIVAVINMLQHQISILQTEELTKVLQEEKL